MDKAQLIEKLKDSEYILPKEVTSVREDELAHILIEIFNEERDHLESEKRFQQNYLELVNYMLVSDLNKPKSRRRNFFDSSFINSLISLPITS